MATTMARVASRGRLLQPRLALSWTSSSALLSVSVAPQAQPTPARQPAPVCTPSRPLSTSSSPSLSASPVRRQAEIEELLLSKLRSVQDPLLEDLPPSQAPNIVAQGYVERIDVDERAKRVDLEIKQLPRIFSCLIGLSK